VGEKTRTILIPEYMQEFQCIGTACEDTCCAGWQVTVDKKTYQKYRSTRHPDLKGMLKENVKRNRTSQSDESYAHIIMESSGNCTMLNEERLCTIQKELGAEYLSNTCAIYPRTLNRVDNIVEKSATLSCPETARLALLNEEGIGFVEVQEPASTRGFMQKNLVLKGKEELFWELRIFTIRILQDRRTTIENRLIILGMFYQRVESLSLVERKEQLENIKQEFEKRIENEEFLTSINNLPKNLSFQLGMCKNLIQYRLTAKITSQRYMDCINEMIEGLAINDGLEEDMLIERYHEAYETSYKPFMEQHEYIVENYLVNYVFKDLFPYDKDTFFESFVMLVINFSMIKMHLIGIGNHNKGLNTKLAVKLVQSYSKTIEHNAEYLGNVKKLLKESGYTTMAHMVVLIKN